MSTDFHNKEFDDGTRIKLEILREYLKQWLPVFLAGEKTYWKKIFIYDFFAGEGSDSIGNYGSPRIILEQLRNYCRNIIEKQIEVKVVFNEFKKTKVQKLKTQCDQQLFNCMSEEESGKYCPNKTKSNKCTFGLLIESQDFNDFFEQIFPQMLRIKEAPRFMFLDQYGIRHITEDVLHKLSQLERTDFIFFTSSSFARRFIENEEFKKYLNLTRKDFSEDKPYHCHRVIFEYYKSLLRPQDNLFLAPFSIKKNSNIYGIIFGTHHTLGMEKFLNICWKINKMTGDANFDIDDERINPNEPKLFEEFNIPSKIQLFENDLKERILKGELNSNTEIYRYSLDSGFLPKHANNVIKELKSQGIIQKTFKTVAQDVHKIASPSFINQ